MLERVGPFKTGEKVRANWLQQMLEALKALTNIRGAGGTRVITTPGGIIITSSAPAIELRTFTSGTMTVTSNTRTVCASSLTLTPGTWIIGGELYMSAILTATVPTNVKAALFYSITPAVLIYAVPGTTLQAGVNFGAGAWAAAGTPPITLAIPTFKFISSGTTTSLIPVYDLNGGGTSNGTIAHMTLTALKVSDATS